MFNKENLYCLGANKGMQRHSHAFTDKTQTAQTIVEGVVWYTKPEIQKLQSLLIDECFGKVSIFIKEQTTTILSHKDNANNADRGNDYYE